ncbi:TonB-dependent receptor [Prosthecobacter sp.]|uniref:TonB-dependent receptor plug domain-containing protein n=1 Tax=Prosthecobacter sp. TaxID=1965333 RepID=UPI002ABC14C6|nr:TonB-dependent receptor [Prosthecobacter sp.]MDZ4404550.1 TonB-dependent receptor [Prosthecobacter sp.]
MRQLPITLLLALTTASFAADPSAPKKTAPSKTKKIPEIVITATRTASPASKVPAVVKTLDKKQMEERLVRTFPEALRETPGITIQKTSNGQGSPFIRGFTGFRNLLLIDGTRFNNSTFREGPNQYWNTIDQFALDHIEVLPSQGGTLYGSDAIGGTVNAFTKGSGFLSEAEGSFFTHGQADYRYASAERSHVEHLEASIGQGQQWGLHLGGTLSQFNDVRTRQGIQRHTGYDQWAFDVRLDVALDDQWQFTIVHQQARQNDVWRTHDTTSGVSFAGTTIGTNRLRLFDQERSLSYLRLAGHDLHGMIDAASLTLSLQTAGEDQYRITGPGVVSYNDVDVTTLGVDLQLESASPIGKLVYGIDYYHDWIESDGANNFAGPVADDSSYDLLGIFIQDEINVCDRVHLFLGGRFTHVRADLGKFRNPVTLTQSNYSDEWANFSASARFLIDLDEHDRFQLFGGVSQSFRAPNLSDLSRDDFSATGIIEVPSTGLNPETYLTYELGLKAQTEAVTTSFSYFFTQIEDMIVRRATGVPGQVSKTNGGDGYMQGVEFATRWQINPHWSVFGQIAWVEGEADQFIGTTQQTRREPLGKIAPLVGFGGVRWQTKDRRFWTELVCLSYGEAARLSTLDQADTSRIPPNGTPSFWLLSLRGGCKVNDHLILTASLENLLNQTYRYHGSGSNEPGFGVNLGATVMF